MNTIIRQIISLDKRAADIQASAIARAEKIDSDTKADLKKSEFDVLNKAKEESAQNYKIEIEKAKDEKNKIIQEMNETLEKERTHYETVKVDYAKQVLKDLFMTID